MNGIILLDGVIAGMSCTGRRSNNEDAFRVEKTGDGYLVAIADGIGGHNAGEVASTLAISTLFTEFTSLYHEGMDEQAIEDLLSAIFRMAHEEVVRNATGDKEGMGTTLVSAFIRDRTIIIANTGDSRAYIIRKGIFFRTKDHSVIQSLLDKHQINEEQAKYHPLRAMLTNSLGSVLQVDTFHLPLHPRDLVILSSDGFHDYVAEKDIATLEWDGPLEELVTRLVNEALEISRDNVTVVVYRDISG